VATTSNQRLHVETRNGQPGQHSDAVSVVIGDWPASEDKMKLRLSCRGQYSGKTRKKFAVRCTTRPFPGVVAVKFVCDGGLYDCTRVQRSVKLGGPVCCVSGTLSLR
jgi:hypothetical protein